MFLSWMPRAPMSSSFGNDVVAVRPESGAFVDPVAICNWSKEPTLLKEKMLAALFWGVGAGKLIVIVPPVKAVVIVDRKIRVRTPASPEPLVLSASLMYVLPALSMTETLEADGSMATVTKTVATRGAFTADTVRVF